MNKLWSISFFFYLGWVSIYAQNLDSPAECQDILGKATRELAVYNVPKHRRLFFEHHIEQVATVKKGEVFRILQTRNYVVIGLWARISTNDILGWVYLGEERAVLDGNFFKSVPWVWICDPAE